MSEQDVENYKQIKTDLDQLRLTVEKSELWVEKNGGFNPEDSGDRQAKEQNNEVKLYHVFNERSHLILEQQDIFTRHLNNDL